MYEELLNENEILPGEVYDKIYVGRTTEVDPAELAAFIGQFEHYSNEELKKHLMQVIYANNRMLTAKG